MYFYPNKKIKNNIKDLDINDLNKVNLKFDFDGIDSVPTSDSKKVIEYRNIVRTKLNCQRLAKSNIKDWKSFITLTYAENMQDVKQSKIDLNYFIKNIKKKKKDFKYIAIPEFQKRGAIHFHLLTNLSKEDTSIIKPQKDNKDFFDVCHWCKGFTSYEEINGDTKKIIGYISKYMTKDCDDRLFGIRRFTSSQNLVKPIDLFIDFNDSKHEQYFVRELFDKEEIYQDKYYDNLGNEVIFMEYRTLEKVVK